MNNILKALKLDVYTAKAGYSKTIILYILVLLLGIRGESTVPILAIMLFSGLFSSFPFLIFNKNDDDKIYGILPIHRKEIVAGRYLFAVLLGLLNLIISIILCLIAAFLSKQDINIFRLVVTISAAFWYYCFMISYDYPIYYKFSFSNSIILTSLPYFLIALFFAFIAPNINIAEMYEIYNTDLQLSAGQLILVLLSGLFLGIIMLIISGFISYRIFKNTAL
ncbi:MAG: ABC-2 transporter permease [Treponema sp.]|jgi:hypothetical protein|nr:ABC-2 transporter permease [Treponema sp.]